MTIIKTTMLSAMLAFSFSSFSQTNSPGQFVVETFFGGPNTVKAFAVLTTSVYDLLPDAKNTTTGFGPIGGRFEYLITEKIGLGFETAFTKAESITTYSSSDMNGDPTTESVMYSQTKIGFMPAIFVHFVDNDQWDVFFEGGMGYKINNRTFDFSESTIATEEIKSVIPISARVAIGARYYITPNFAVNAQFGVGNSGVLQGGLTYRR
ncbi:MAG: hypothetical protein ACI9XP_001382 [Lentimonas sp.]|jgi:hypothetical protein